MTQITKPLCLMATAFALTLAGLTLPAETDAQVRRLGVTTKATASSRRPATNRARPARYVNPTRARANATVRDNRAQRGRSAAGDGRRNGVRLRGSPLTWSGWNRAVPPRTTAAQTRSRTTAGQRRVTFRSSPRR